MQKYIGKTVFTNIVNDYNLIHVSLVEGVFHVEKYMAYTNHVIDLECDSCIFVEEVIHVSLLKNYVHDANHMIDWNVIQVEPKGEFFVQPISIFGRKIKVL